MTEIELDKYRITLQDKLAEMTNGNRDRGALTVEPEPDEMDHTRGGQERDMAVEICNRDAKLLSGLRSALNRIARDTFGICIDCEFDISRKRLAAVPWAALCIVCQEAVDNSAAEESLENAA